MGARTVEAPIEYPFPAIAPRFRGVAHLAAFVAAVPLGAMLVLDAGWQLPILTVVWGGAVVATAARLLWPDAPSWLASATCMALGWISVTVLPQIVEGMLPRA